MHKQLKSIPISLYIHVPWCIQKCPYCDFNSHVLKINDNFDNYVRALLLDLSQEIELFNLQHIKLKSIFFGGGTPNVLPASYIHRILDVVAKFFNINNIEMTMEVNPGAEGRVDSSEIQNLRGYLHAGINRWSVGVQSFNDDNLQALGRIHDGATAHNFIMNLQDLGAKRLNIDLMHGLPKQNIENALQDLHIALSLKPTHISWYQLTIEPNTYFYKYPPVIPEEDLLWSIFTQGNKILEDKLGRYEISAYGMEDMCQHNINYWSFGDFIGIGAGAAGKITLSNGNIIRRYKTKIPNDYINILYNNKTHIRTDTLTKQNIIFEFMLNAMRLTKGISVDIMKQRTGLSIQDIRCDLEIAKTKKLVDYNDEYIKPTKLGLLFLNDLLEIFLKPAPVNYN